MAEDIINRVAGSKLITFDLEDLYPKGERVRLDIKDWLLDGLVLREKDFREQARTHDWKTYEGQYIALTCSSDAIIPGWAYLLLTTYLGPYARKVVQGSLEMLETILYTELIRKMDLEAFRDKPVIIKGCSRKPVPVNAYLLAIERLQPVAKSLMYGEACSAVPLFKRTKP